MSDEQLTRLYQTLVRIETDVTAPMWTVPDWSPVVDTVPEEVDFADVMKEMRSRGLLPDDVQT
jgi:hypothetical protein